MPALYCVSKLKDLKTALLDPAEICLQVPPEVAAKGHQTVADYIDRHASQFPSCFFSGVEGLNPLHRVAGDETNPAHTLRALVVDYDCAAPAFDEMGGGAKVVKAFAAMKKLPLIPNWVARSKQGFIRTIYEYEEPLPVPGNAFVREFRKQEAKLLHLDSIFPGFDEAPVLNPCQYFDIGTCWTRVHDTPVPSAFLHQIAYEAGHRIRFCPREHSIPIADVAAEVARQWPGRWQGPFEVGRRGVRFWDASATNPTAAVVREEGMQCFSGPDPFLSWTKLLGDTFAARYAAEHTGQIARDTFFDGRSFWLLYADGRYYDMSSDMLKDDLISRGVSNRPDKNGMSELRKILAHVRRNNRVHGARPFVHYPRGVLEVNGNRYLNTASTAPMEPADTPLEVRWGVGFPWLARFFEGLFATPGQLQMERFLAWWQRFYRNALRRAPMPGQILMTAGPVNCGKSFMVSKILAPAVGGYYDASTYLLGEDGYPGEEQFSSPIWAVDDTSPASSRERHNKYSSMIKKVAASHQLRVNEKYAKSGMSIWKGRVCISANTDQESMRLVPNTEQSLLDKIFLFKCRSPAPGTFDHDQAADCHRVMSELPFMLKWLVEWTPPDHCSAAGDTRFGVASYHHPDLLASARANSESDLFLEILSEWLETYRTVEGQQSITVSANELYDHLSKSSEAISREFNLTRVRKMLGQLQSQGYEMSATPDEHGNRTLWTMPTQLKRPELVEASAREE